MQSTREAVLASLAARCMIDTPTAARLDRAAGARRIDDLSLIKYRETVDPKSPPIVLLSPSGSPHPFYAEFGWVGAPAPPSSFPTADTVWTPAGSGTLGVGRPVTLTWDNGEGLEFRRTIAVDDKYLFTIEDQVDQQGQRRRSRSILTR